MECGDLSPLWFGAERRVAFREPRLTAAIHIIVALRGSRKKCILPPVFRRLWLFLRARRLGATEDFLLEVGDASARPEGSEAARPIALALGVGIEGKGERGPGERNTAGCRGCAHVSLGTDLGMPPADAGVHADATVFERIDLLAMLQPRSDVAGCEHPPSTGPPRCDRRTALRATTVLRI